MAYVYQHIRLDKNEVFYIGIGSDNKGKHERSKHKKRKRNKIWNDITKKTDYIINILYDNISWEEACEKEKEFIKLYGKIINGTGTLCNMSDGGEGVLGIKQTKETIDKRIKNTDYNKIKENTNNWAFLRTPESRKKAVANTDYKIINSQETIDKRRKNTDYSKIGKHLITPENLKKIHEPIAREKRKISTNNYAHLHTPEVKAKAVANTDYFAIAAKINYKEVMAKIDHKAKTEKRMIPVIQLSKSGEYIKEWKSAKDASIELKIDNGDITNCCRYKKKSAGGFTWLYKNR